MQARSQFLRQVEVTVIVDQTEIISVVEDNGQGFVRKNVDSAHSGVLVNMADRATSMGGTCSIDSSPDEGTRVKASFPLDDALSPTPDRRISEKTLVVGNL